MSWYKILMNIDGVQVEIRNWYGQKILKIKGMEKTCSAPLTSTFMYTHQYEKNGNSLLLNLTTHSLVVVMGGITNTEKNRKFKISRRTYI